MTVAKKMVMHVLGKKGWVSLNAFLDRFGSHSLDYVVGAPDFGSSEDYCEAIAEECKKRNVRFYKRPDAPELTADFSFAIGWRWILKSPGTVVVLHDSLLPKYRGFAPLVSALINRDTRIGVTALIATSEYDRGEILNQASIDVRYPLKIADAIESVLPLYASLITEIGSQILSEKPLVGTPQIESEATYSLWREEADYRICWSMPAEKILALIDSVGHPYRGASALLENELVRISEAEIYPDVRVENRGPGKVIFIEKNCPVVVCGSGLLRVTSLRADSDGSSRLPLKKFRSRFT